MTATRSDYRLDDRYLRQDGTILLTGVQALARLPIEQLRRDIAAGLRTAAFLSGYPGSPLAGFDLEVGRALRLVPDLPIVHTPALNEELAATSVMGTQFVAGRSDARVDGVTGYWYGKAPGVDRASDALRHAVFAGTGRSGGAIALVGDDPANKSSTLPSSSAAALVGLGMPLFYPGNVAECIELGLHAVAASRATGLWSAMKIITPVGDGTSTFDASDFGESPLMPTMSVDGHPYECVPSGQLLGARLLDIEREIHEIRTPLAREYGALNGLNRITVDPPDAWIGMIASGYTYYELLHALERLGLTGERAIADAGIRLLHLRMPVPFDPDLIRRFADGLDEVLVLEDKDDTVESRVRDALYSASHRPLVTGKRTPDGAPLVPSWGLLDAAAIEPAARARLARRLDARLTPARVPRERVMIPLTVARSPYFCSGCPHNWSTKVPDGAEVGAGIGCSTMVLMMDEDRVGQSIGITAMGNEGAQWTGMRPFIDADHIFQNLGDGTYFHSGQLAIQHAISAGSHITFKLLYNGTVAMTGGQASPGMRSVAEIAGMLLGQGVTRVAITTDESQKYRRVRLPHGVKVHPREEIVAVQETLRDTPGVTVLIHDQACAAETRRRRRRGTAPTPTHRVLINERVCEGCGDCGQVSNCLSVQPVETPFGRKTMIDQASCNLDLSCLGGDCPAFITVDTSTTRREVAGSPTAAATPVPAPPEPATALPGVSDSYRIRLAGIGGTGVITAAQILATAAMLDGWQSSGLDQTGLSQKAGPVVSDLVLTRGSAATSNHIGPGEADLILAFDALTAAADGVIAAADPDRTVVIASTHRTPTGSMVTSPDIAYPAQSAIAERLDGRSRSESNLYVDAWELSSERLGSGNYSNTLLLGTALQSGAIPVTLDSIVQAINLNGTDVDRNLAALELGRLAAATPNSPVAAHDEPDSSGDAVDLDVARRVEALVENSADRALISRLATDLVGYHDRRYAHRYLDHVADAATAETEAIGEPGSFTVAVARNLHKVMAYKDEYEVARLMLLPATRRQVEQLGGPTARFAWHLHPPMLRSLGVRRKIAIGDRAAVVFRVLRAARLRGTWIDPFGHTQHRRSERRLVDEYTRSLERVHAVLSPATIAAATRAAELPDRVRGYGELKEQRIAEFHSAMSEALDDLEGAPRTYAS